MSEVQGSTWAPEGEAVSRIENIKVLSEQLGEPRALAQEALEDAVPIGSGEPQFREVLRRLAAFFVNPFKKDRA